MIEVIYNSEAYYVVEYTEQRGYEIVDKVSGVGAYLEGEVAKAFFVMLERVASDNPPRQHRIDSFLSQYRWAMFNLQVYH